MSSSCDICEDLIATRQGSCPYAVIERSSLDGCDGCSLLYRAAYHVLTNLHPEIMSDTFQRDALELWWWRTVSRNGFQIKIVNLLPEGSQTVLSVLELHSEPGIHTKWTAIGSAGLVTVDSSSAECVEKIKNWLQQCRTEHPKCMRIKTEWSQRIPVPAKRVIDVGDERTQPRLVEDIVRGYFVTLSHCWGLSNPLTTTKATLHERRKGIAMEELPPTFRQAVILTRALGLRYLWIDSLCICQDDPKEWKQEAIRMWEIYGGSYLTIAATAAADSSKGMFSYRDGSSLIPGTEIYVRKKIDHSVFRMPVLNAVQHSEHEVQADKYPLFQRGWCLQERLLSNRIVHFTADEMVWQCRSCDMCECDGIQQLGKTRSSSDLTSRLKYNRVVGGNCGSDIWTIWREIVEDYCSTNLSRDSDHLPALSGVAAKFGLNGAGTYIAGLWHKPGALSLGSSPLFLDLLWKSSTQTARRPYTKVAPSFSWASRMGPIQYRNEARDGPLLYKNYARDGKQRPIHKCIFVVQFVQAWDGLDRYAETPNATLEIRCQLLPCSAKIEGERCSVVLGAEAIEHEITPDVPDAVRQETDAELFVMPVAAYENQSTLENMFDGLVLAKVGTATYERVGMVERLSERWLSASGHESIVLT